MQTLSISIMENIFIEKLSEDQKLINKGFHFSAAAFHLLNQQVFLIYLKK